MTSRLLISVPCRVYGLIASAAAIVALLLAAVFLGWARIGPSHDLLIELGPSMSAAEFKRLSMGLGVMCLVFGALHAVVGVLALLGRTWAMIAGTVAWAVFLAPSMFANQASAYDCAGVIVLGLLCLLTLLTLAGHFASTDEARGAAAVA